MRALLVMSAIFACSAQAGWSTLTATGTPRDVNVWAPGDWTLAAGSSGAFRFQGTTVDAGIITGSLTVGTALTSSGCLAALDEIGDLSFICPGGMTLTPRTIFSTGGATSLRSTSDAGAFAMQTAGADITACYLPQGAQPTGTLDCQNIITLSPSDVLAVHRSGTFDYAAFGRAGNGVGLVKAGSLAATHPAPGRVEAIQLFGDDGTVEALVSTVDAGLLHTNFSGAPTGIPLPAGIARVSGLSFETGTGSFDEGDGFGMAIGHGTVHRVLSAVPAGDAFELGRRWIESTAQPAVDLTNFTRLDCFGGRYCVAIQPVSGTTNVLVYSNDSPPVLSLGSTSALVAEGTAVQVTATATDPDGDAVRLSWRRSAVNPGPAAIFTGVDGLLDIDTSGLGLCQEETANFTVLASDGLSSHVQSASYALTITPVVPPDAPTVMVLPSSTVEAGGETVRLVAGSASTGCPAQSFVWTPMTGARAIVIDGGEAYFVPDETKCDPTLHDYEVRAVGAADASVATPVRITQTPFGRPLAPFAGAATFSADAGVTLRIAPEQTHACSMTAGFLGVTTNWAPVGSLPTGIRLVGDDGIARTGAFDSAFIDVQSDACSAIAPQTFSIVVTNSTRASVSMPRQSSIQVEVETKLGPFPDATFSLGAPVASAGEAQGTLAVGGINCAEERGLSAELRLFRAGELVTPLSTVLTSAPGPYSVTLPDACAAGDFRLDGTLRDSDDTPGAKDSVAFSTVRLEAAVGTLTPELVKVSCDEGLRSTVALQPVEGACNAVGLRWEQQSGPPLESAVLEGREVELIGATRELSQLIGQSVTFRVDATAATDNVASREVSVFLTADPFLFVTHAPERPIVEEGDLVEITAFVSNPSPCPLNGVTLEERLEGLTLVPTSVRGGGEPIVVTPLEQGRWAFSGISVPAEGRAEIRYLARTSLLGEPRVSGQASLSGVPLSEPGGFLSSGAGTGCGCQSGGGSFAPWMFLSVLLVFARRGRSVRVRS